MPITDSFKNAVSSGNVRGIRIMMKDSLLVDPTFTEFDEMSESAKDMAGLYDDTHGELEEDESAWNEDYMNKLMVQVVGNFSHERLKHLKEVVNYLRPAAADSKNVSKEGGSDHANKGDSSGATSSGDQVQSSIRAKFQIIPQLIKFQIIPQLIEKMLKNTSRSRNEN